MRVLLIEDTPRLAEAVAEILRKSGYGADIAHIGADGLAMALTGAYDAVLLDIMLPDMSGMDVLRELREAGSVVPVILLTARWSTIVSRYWFTCCVASLKNWSHRRGSRPCAVWGIA